MIAGWDEQCTVDGGASGADSDELHFVAEGETPDGENAVEPWSVLIVDDEPDIHTMTELLLGDFRFRGRPLAFLRAYSAHDARLLLTARRDIAVALIDVVIEDEAAGLNLVRFIRDDLHNRDMRLILRTGQPGQAPQRDVVVDYEIDGYVAKADLSADVLFITVVSALRAYEHIISIETRVAERTRQLSESHERLMSILESSPSGVGVLDSAGRITFCNHRLASMLGVPPPELRGASAETMFATSEEFQRYMLAVRRRMKIRDQEVRLRRRDGRPFWALMSGDITRLHGTDLYLTWIYNIERRKRSETELSAAKEQAEQATRAKSAFLATMSHEIRTPMNGVLGMIDMLERTELDPFQRDTVATIRESGGTLLRIIDDILDFSKIEAGRLKLEWVPMSITATIESVAGMLAPSAWRKRLELISYTDPTLPASVISDPLRLRQILLNLIGNAIKFTDQGRVLVGATCGPLEHGQALLRIEVTDSGIGISRAAQTLLFEPYAQVETSTSRRFGGTGLGLSICRRLAEMMGGQIGVDSAQGEGSTFWVTLPLAISDRPVTGAGCRVDAGAGVPGESGTGDDAGLAAGCVGSGVGSGVGAGGEGGIPVAGRAGGGLSVDEPSLSGVPIVVAVGDDVAGDCLLRYLRAAGAEVVRVGDGAALLALTRDRAAAGRPFNAAVLDGGLYQDKVVAVREALGFGRNGLGMGAVLLVEGGSESGPRLRPRAGGTVTVPKPVRRADLIRATAIAAGVVADRPEPPAVPATAAGTVRVGRTAARAGGRAPSYRAHVLVVEDNPTNRKVIEAQLGMLGYSLEMCENGVEALAILDQMEDAAAPPTAGPPGGQASGSAGPPGGQASGSAGSPDGQAPGSAKRRRFDAILTDCHMPEMDGFEMTRLYREREQARADGRRMPVIAVTANAFAGDEERYRKAGMDVFLCKPIDLDLLGRILKQWIPDEALAPTPGAAAPAPSPSPQQVVPPADVAPQRERGPQDHAEGGPAATTAAPVAPPIAELLAAQPAVGDPPAGQPPVGVLPAGQPPGNDPPASKQPAVDLRVLTQICGDDHDFLREILDDYIRINEPIFRAVLAMVTAREAPGLRDRAHNLKGASRTAGAKPLGEICRALEAAAPAGDWDEIERIAADLVQEFERVTAFVLAY